MKREKKTIFNMDVIRLIVSIFVIVAHTHPLLFFSEMADYSFTRIINRVSVPFFLMISGYFVIPKILKDKKVLIDYTKKIAFMYAIAIILYLPINYRNGYFEGATIWYIIKEVLFEGTFFHLWYFPAILWGIWVTYFLAKKFDIKKALGISLGLYVIALLGDSYYNLTAMFDPLKAVYEFSFKISYYTRNGILYAPIFIMMGYEVAIHKEKTSNKKDLILGILFLIGMYLEGLLVYHFDLYRHNTMYVLLIPTTYFLYRSIMNTKMNTNKVLRDVSTWIYMIHPFFISVVRVAGRVTHLDFLYSNELINFIVVSIISFCVAYAIVKMKTFFKERKMKKA